MQMRIYKGIVADPEILGGKLIVEGTRLSVAHVLGLLGRGMTIDELIESYPFLTKDDILQVITYAANALENDFYMEFN